MLVLRLPLSVPYYRFPIPTQFSFASIIPSFLCPRSVFPCQNHSSISPYSLGFPLSAFSHHFSFFILCSPVSIFSPLLHTNIYSSTNHANYSSPLAAQLNLKKENTGSHARTHARTQKTVTCSSCLV